MPYTYELRNRQRVKRALVSGVLLVFLFLLLVLAPARILAWAGLTFGSLTAPEATVAPVDEPVAMAVAKILTPPLLEPMTFPAYAEWSDIDAACGDCDSFSYGIGGDLDPVDIEQLSRLEHSSGVGTGAGAGSGYRTAGSSGGAGSAGGGGGGGAGFAAVGAGEATEDTSGSTAADAEPTADAASDSSSGSSSAPEAVAADAAPASQPTNLILSSIAPDSGGLAGPAAGALSQDVVQALIESPAGSETVHSAGEPEVISAALNLDEGAAAAGGDAGAQQETIPEPMSFLLVGLGLSAGVFRLRRIAR